jgi:NADH-quinone oxidoreductase subunit M
VVLVVSGIYPAYLTEPITASVQPVAEALARAGALSLTR